MRKFLLFFGFLAVFAGCFSASQAQATMIDVWEECLGKEGFSGDWFDPASDLTEKKDFEALLKAGQCYRPQMDQGTDYYGWYLIRGLCDKLKPKIGYDCACETPKVDACNKTNLQCLAACFIPTSSGLADPQEAICKNKCSAPFFECRKQAALTCESGFIAKVQSYMNSLTACTDRQVRIDGECHNISEFCGNDPHILYQNKSCYCPDGMITKYEGEKKTCRSKEQEEETEIECDYRQILIGGKCHNISEFCGNDPKILYDTGTKECVCPRYYVLKTENGQKACQEASQINLQVSVVEGYPTPPLLADGKTQTKLKIKATYANGQPVKLSFKLGYSSAHQNGKILTTEGDAQNGYVVAYQAPELAEVEARLTDYLNIHYKTLETDEEKYENYGIELYTPVSTEVKIEKVGFKTITAPIIFEGRKAKIFVYVQADDKKYPVVDAKVHYGKMFPKSTDKKGMVVIESDKEYRSNKETLNEIELLLNSESLGWQKEAALHYKESGQFNFEITDFIVNFAKHLAATKNDDEAKKTTEMLECMAYTFYFLHHGNDFAEDISMMIGDTFGDVVWETLEFVSSLYDLSDKSAELLHNLAPKDFKMTPEKFQMLKELINELPRNTKNTLFNELKRLAVKFTANLNPVIFQELEKTFFEEKVVKEFAKGVLNAFKVQQMVADRFKKSHQDFNRQLVLSVARAIKNQDFKEFQYSFQTAGKVSIAKSKYSLFTIDFLHERHEFGGYVFSMLKNYSDLVRSTILKGIQIYTLDSSVGKALKNVDKFLDGMDIVIGASQMKMWFNAYGDNQKMIKETVSELMELNLAYQSNQNQEMIFAPLAVAAEEPDFLQIMYDNEVPADQPDRQKVFDYLESKNKTELYDNLSLLAGLVAEMDPQNKEAERFKAEMQSKLAKFQKNLNQTQDKIAALDILKPKPEKKTALGGSDWLGLIYAAVLIVILGLFILLIARFWRKGQNQPAKRLYAIILSLILIGLVIYLLPLVINGLKNSGEVGITQEMPEELKKI